MKVVILTQPLGHNYGGLLQAYALQTHLKKLGCDVETLDRRAPDSGVGVSFRGYISNVIRLLLGRIKSIPTKSRQARVFDDLIAFREQRLSMSPTITSEQKIRDYFRIRDFDTVVVGSDQVWRPRYSPSILNYYLDFLYEIERPSKRLAYAASFGVDDWEYTDELTEQCRKLVQQFDAVSVRESSAIEFCKEKLGVSAKWLVDPTMLLEPTDYDQLINEYDESKSGECVLSYVLDPAEEKRSIAKIVANTLDVNVFSIKPEFSVAQVRVKDLDTCKYPSVESWVQAFREASFVVTDSFHGTVFAILFNKPFIAVGNSTRGKARFESLLSQFGLIKRLVDSKSEVTSELIHEEIDWDFVNAKLRALSEEAQEFLRLSLFGK